MSFAKCKTDNTSSIIFSYQDIQRAQSVMFLQSSWLSWEKQHFENSHQPRAKLRKLITFWHGPGTDISCNAASRFLSVVVTSVELNTIPCEMPQAWDNQRLLELNFFKRFLFLCILRCSCRRVWRGCNGGYHHSGVCYRAEVSSFSWWPIK